MATGIWSAPVESRFPGRETFVGRALHVSAYRGPDELAGARVLVVGLGNSGKDVALAAAEVGASTTVAVRDGALLVPYPNVFTQHAGALLQRVPPRLADALLWRLRREPVEYGLRWLSGPPTQAYPVVGLELLAALRAGRVGLKPAMTAYAPTPATCGRSPCRACTWWGIATPRSRAGSSAGAVRRRAWRSTSRATRPRRSHSGLRHAWARWMRHLREPGVVAPSALRPASGPPPRT